MEDFLIIYIIVAGQRRVLGLTMAALGGILRQTIGYALSREVEGRAR